MKSERSPLYFICDVFPACLRRCVFYFSSRGYTNVLACEISDSSQPVCCRLSPLITNLKSLKREILCVDVLRYLIKKSSFLQKGLRYVPHFKTSRCLIGDETRSFRNLQQNRLITVLILFSIGKGKCHWIKFESNRNCFLM